MKYRRTPPSHSAEPQAEQNGDFRSRIAIMEIRLDQDSAGHLPRHCAEGGRGRLTALTTDSALIFISKPNYKMFYLYLGVALFLCLPNSIYCVHGQPKDIVEINKGPFGNSYEQYYQQGEMNIEGEAAIQHQTSFTDKLRKKFLIPEDEKVKGKPLTLKAEIKFGWQDMKDFLRGLRKSSSTTTHQQTQENHQQQHRSARDTEPQMNTASDGPWTSNLSPAAVVGSIVGSTVAVFLIVVLTVIFCSYKNYSSLEVRQRTADVYGGNGYNSHQGRQAERRM